MKTSLIGVDPIPVEFVLNVAQSKGTTAQRRPYVECLATGSPKWRAS